ncbi:CynX/NimT family MFS transporter [Raoultella ornithinolytica]|jgi:CP family cyanate transporter-like MFS transporter|uniref:CynX/NimT family MFS transporter n=1 Tax=Raoultella ornithinolytica TaxID=54291 RepID=A0A9Q9N214_RAOOR|nr:CynX/NimT family MFS transporter [Raoultella ornithinolytica]ANZ05620.1 membrane protein [Raoultella ornithinolytica]EHT10149.1 inner membrane transporter YeaN [Raoultella ornithinolytica 10-5246]EJD6651122.1 CynX/NimT family MFS transporter [Raoultella ornithinolytica]EJG2380648.1 CynX/NimT family MFS transporter [Raoultella ornithinolytica]EKU2861229.1 CynX/NimT family MFS transporter [Raoultella ornithinolytica]
MSSVLPSTGRRHLLLIAGILFIASTLRVTFTGAAPLLDAIRADYGLSTAQTGMLTTLPLLAFGLVSPLAAGVGRRLGIERSLLVALVLICLGIGLRSLPSTALLFGGTAIIGCGIALGNVLLPGLIKRDFSQHVARMTGAYSITMGGAAALGSAMVVPLALAGFGWHGALLMLMVFPLLALLVWLPQTRKTATAPLTGSGAMHNRGIWRSALAWQVTLFLGINSLVYYVIIGWLPAILQSLGYSEAQAGSLHGLLQLATAAPGLAIPLILHRLKDQRAIAIIVALMCAISACGLWFWPGQAVVWTLVFGFGSGATMILGLTFIGLRANSAHQAAALSGMAQTIGYLLAACGPPLMGKIHDANGDWQIPLLAVALISVVMALFGALAGRDREING